MLSHNPLDVAEHPKIPRKERRWLDASEVAGLLERLDVADARQFAVSMMLRTGLRAGECLGAQWSDVDGCGVHVRRETTKTDAGVRTVPLSPADAAFVEGRRALVASFLESLGAEMDGTKALCCNLDGTQLTYEALRSWWRRAKGPLGLDGMRIHDLRHTYVSNLAQAGVHPSVMQRLAGHSSTAPTLRVYTHVNQMDMQRAVDALAKAREERP